MKKLLFILFANLLILPLSAQFKANMIFTSMGQERTFKVYSAEAGYRYEFNEQGQEGVIIVRKGSPEIIILMPMQKMAMKGSADSPMSMGNDPVLAFEYYRDRGLLKDEGIENINGVRCTRSSLWNRDNPEQKMFTVWLSDKYKFPVRMINHIDGSGNWSWN
ncbi:MAG: hypothetical protein R2727_08490 [Bacteroidales bacterium]